MLFGVTLAQDLPACPLVITLVASERVAQAVAPLVVTMERASFLVTVLSCLAAVIAPPALAITALVVTSIALVPT